MPIIAVGRTVCLSVVALCLGMLTSIVCLAQDRGNAPSLVTPAELATQLNDPALVLLHVGSDASYAKAHIPGARHVTLARVSAPRGEGRLTLEVPPGQELHDALWALGITNASRVVVYWADDWVSPATRVVFTLDYAGLGGQTHLLDGGLAGWMAAGQPVTDTATAPVVTGGTLTVRPRPSAVATLDDLKPLVGGTTSAAGASTVIVDARTPDFHAGTNDRRGAIPRPGHVPGAVNLPFTGFFATVPATGDAPETSVLKPRAELEAMFAGAGIPRGATVITYCHIGQQATVPFFVARLLGYDVRLYDGSFEEWSANTSVPVEK